MNADGTPKWRMAPSPHGSYWKEGMKLGYQDVGSLTLLKSTPLDRRKAAWLYAQFIVSKTVVAEEEPCRPDLHPRERHPGQALHRARAEARRPDRVLPLARARAVDADRHQRARLSEAGAALVAEHRRCVVRREDAAGRRWTRSPPRRTRCWSVSRSPASRATAGRS